MSLYLSKYHIVGNHMSRLIYNFFMHALRNKSGLNWSMLPKLINVTKIIALCELEGMGNTRVLVTKYVKS